MEKQFNELTHKVDEIHRLLIGSEHEQEVGILFRIRKNEADMKSIQNWKEKITYFAYGAVIPTCWGMVDILRYLKSIL